MSIVRAFQRNRVELLVLEHDVVALVALIALDLVCVLDRLAGLGVDILALDAVAGRAVEGVETYLLRI
jgi:hypothetical protein